MSTTLPDDQRAGLRPPPSTADVVTPAEDRSPTRREQWVLVVLASAASVVAYLYFDHQNTILGYKDTISHLLIGRRVVVGEVTGLAQLGGVWLPLQHVLIATLAWNDTLYSTGLAGSVFSMASYVAAVVLVWRIVLLVTGDRVAAWASALVFGLSANLLYLQATPMGEPVMYAGMLWAVWLLLSYLRTDRPTYLFASAIVAALLVYVRYEAWVFSAALWFVLLYTCLRQRRRMLAGDQAGQGSLIVYGFYMTLAVLGWQIWNQVIFGDWAGWLNGMYSSIAQTGDIDTTQTADFRHTFLTYWYGMTHTVTLPLLALGVAGLVVMAWRERLSPQFAVLLATIAPAAFIMYGLYAGTQPMNVMEVDGVIYNLRMALLMLLPAVLFTGYLISCLPRRGWLGATTRTVAMLGLAALPAVTLTHAVETDGDSVIMSLEARQARASFAEQREVGAFVAERTHGRVLVQSFGNEWVVFPIQERVIYEGSQDLWTTSLDSPAREQNRIEVVVMRTTPGYTDEVCDELGNSVELTSHFRLLLTTDDFRVYGRTS